MGALAKHLRNFVRELVATVGGSANGNGKEKGHLKARHFKPG